MFQVDGPTAQVHPAWRSFDEREFGVERRVQRAILLHAGFPRRQRGWDLPEDGRRDRLSGWIVHSHHPAGRSSAADATTTSRDEGRRRGTPIASVHRLHRRQVLRTDRRFSGLHGVESMSKTERHLRHPGSCPFLR